MTVKWLNGHGNLNLENLENYIWKIMFYEAKMRYSEINTDRDLRYTDTQRLLLAFPNILHGYGKE